MTEFLRTTGSGEAADHVALHEDESGPDEADAGDDLRGDA